jgi:nicotinate-nucleotide pyrophosphorylase (carboxylating)
MPRDFRQLEWDAACAQDCRELIQLGVREDLGRTYDWTTLALVPPQAQARAAIVAREEGVIAGLPAVPLVLTECDARLGWQPLVEEGATIARGRHVGWIQGPARSLLAAERLLLNIVSRLSGIASHTARYVAAAGSKARVYDTRKTTPGWRRLEKYAVRIGGGHNHRLNLFEAILIKDNHLALGADPATGATFTPAEAVHRAREFLATQAAADCLVEIEVDSLQQLQMVLPARPDIVLLDNMSLHELRSAVAMRDALAPQVELEASGGIDLQTLPAVAATGVERISVGALTHAAHWLDLGLDWLRDK